MRATADVHAHTSGRRPPTAELAPPEAAPRPRAVRALRAIVAAAIACSAVGLLIAPERALRGWLAGEVYLVGLGLGATFFVALQYVTGAGWSVAFRRVPEAMMAALPWAALGFVPVLVGARGLYAWARPEVVAADPVIAAKSGWLSLPFFALRAAACFAIWIGLGRSVIARSIRQDGDGALEHTRANVRRSVVLIIASALSLTVASFDWLMSLDARWFSTIYAVYQWAGLFLSALAAMTLLVIHLRREGPLAGVVRDDHLLDLGRLVFGFSTFWAYIWFSQFMLIWYANIPEEATYYAGRIAGPWGTLFVVNLCLNWAVPFLMLLPREAKRSEVVLGRVCALLLVGRALDLYLDISQPALQGGPGVGPLEIAPVAAALAVFLLAFRRAYGRAAPVPRRDPMIEESLHHHL
jgi:hypothetical protein